MNVPYSLNFLVLDKNGQKGQKLVPNHGTNAQKTGNASEILALDVPYGWQYRSIFLVIFCGWPLR